MRAFLLLFGVLLAACGGSPKPVAISSAPAEVEPVFDTPREYRRHVTMQCGVGSGLVYVFTTAGDLHAFDPPTLTFRRIGAISCPGAPGRPNSMAVDRAGTAWVNYLDGRTFLVSTRDASCKPSGIRPGQHGFNNYGMAFVSTGEGLSREALFVSSDGDTFGGDNGFGGLGRFDGTKLTPIAQFSGRLRGMTGELTGTGDGRLFGFFPTRPATLAEIDPKTARVLSEQRLPTISFFGAWAHAFWGGSFYLFWARQGEGSHVSRVSMDGRIEHVIRDANMQIVGAGVSTCAPTSTE